MDGNDALAVYAAMQWAADRARNNGGPTLIEYFTYRGEGHSTSDDPGAYRAAEEYTSWPLGDPVTRLKDHLIAIGAWGDAEHDALIIELSEYVKTIQKEAEENGILGIVLHRALIHI